MTYLDRPTPARGAPWAHNTLGAVVHLALHRWWQLPPARAHPGSRAARWSSATGSTTGSATPTSRRPGAVRARGWVERYLDDVDPDDEPVGVERTVATRTDRLAVSGRVDRIDDRDGELVIVDYKTGRRIPDRDDRPRLAGARAVRAGRGAHAAPAVSSGRAAPSAVGHGRRLRPHRASLARHIDRAEASADDIVAATDTLAAGAHTDEVFPPRPGPGCSWCDFRGALPRRAAGLARAHVVVGPGRRVG